MRCVKEWVRGAKSGGGAEAGACGCDAENKWKTVRSRRRQRLHWHFYRTQQGQQQKFAIQDERGGDSHRQQQRTDLWAAKVMMRRLST